MKITCPCGKDNEFRGESGLFEFFLVEGKKDIYFFLYHVTFCLLNYLSN